MQEFQNAHLSVAYFQAIKLIKEYRSQENLPDTLNKVAIFTQEQP